MKIACACLLLAAPAMAEPLPDGCAPARSPVVAQLAGQYGERQIAVWIDPETGPAMEMFANPRTGSSTVLRNEADGVTCIVSVGVYFTFVEPAPEGEPA